MGFLIHGCRLPGLTSPHPLPSPGLKFCICVPGVAPGTSLPGVAPGLKFCICVPGVAPGTSSLGVAPGLKFCICVPGVAPGPRGFGSRVGSPGRRGHPEGPLRE